MTMITSYEVTMKIIISNASSDPIYEQIMGQIKQKIISGELRAGDALPSLRNLARDLGISVITTKRSYEELERAGFIDTVSGKGCFVAMQNTEFLREQKMKIIEDKLSEAIAEARLLGISYTELQTMFKLLYEETE
jgi:GntR family transcriptional regulator